MLAAALTWPFEGLALPWEILFGICLLVVVAMFLWSLLLFVRAHAAIAHPPEAPPDGAEEFSWVFLVPALNEEVTIADSVERLLAMPVRQRRIVVIDDGSDRSHRRRSSPRSTTPTSSSSAATSPTRSRGRRRR